MQTSRDLLGHHPSNMGTAAGKKSGCLRTLGAVLRTALLAILHALRVQRAADDVVTTTRKVLHASTPDQHNRVFLQVVAFAADVRDHLEAVGQAHLRNLAQRRVRFLRRGRIDTGAYAALLRAVLQRW